MTHKRYAWIVVFFLAAFLLWTAAVASVDIQAIGPEGSAVGFAAINGFVHNTVGVHLALYHITDWLSLIPLLFIAGFSVLGCTQWARRRSIRKVDHSILALGVFYIITGAVYLFFEKCIINYRPVLIQGILEASYPSSTTMLVICVMCTAALQLHGRIQNSTLRTWTICLIAAFSAFMVIGRFLSGVHWLTDIIGGILLSICLVAMYISIVKHAEKKRDC